MKELISIIVAVYNGENYLNQCIESIVNQTYKELEIIIVDDGSNDSSYNIIKKYGERDDRIKIIKSIQKTQNKQLNIKNMEEDISR